MVVKTNPNWVYRAGQRLASYCVVATLPLTAIAQSAPQLPPGWHLHGDRLECTYELANFIESVVFVAQLITPAETLGHHPDVTIAYNRVSLSLTTHDADGLTDLDFQLAEEIHKIARYQATPLSCLTVE